MSAMAALAPAVQVRIPRGIPRARSPARATASMASPMARFPRPSDRSESPPRARFEPESDAPTPVRLFIRRLASAPGASPSRRAAPSSSRRSPSPPPRLPTSPSRSASSSRRTSPCRTPTSPSATSTPAKWCVAFLTSRCPDAHPLSWAPFVVRAHRREPTGDTLPAFFLHFATAGALEGGEGFGGARDARGGSATRVAPRAP